MEGQTAGATLSANTAYCDVPGSPCLSKKLVNVRSVHLWMDQRIPDPCLVAVWSPGGFVGDPTSLARDNIAPGSRFISIQ